MDAKTARELTDRALKVGVIKPYIETIDRRIGEAITKGKYSINNPHIGLIAQDHHEYFITGELLTAVKQHYLDQGYQWLDFPDPDPGHPCSSAYTTLSW